MNRATLVCLMSAVFVTIFTPVAEIISKTFYDFMYWSSIILYIITAVLLVKEERKHGWPYKD